MTHPQLNRRPLDARRVAARLVDEVIIAVLALAGIAFGLEEWDALLVIVALQLSYFFVLEAYWGQTVGKAFLGLRVMAVDGSPAGASAVAARTILRLVEEPLIAVIALLLSGPRRRRLGDLLGGTMVGRVSECPVPTPATALHLVYPIAWVALALGAALVLPAGEESEYLASLDAICAERVAAQERMPAPLDPVAILEMSVQETEQMAELEPPPADQALHAHILENKRRFERLLAAAIELARTSRDGSRKWVSSSVQAEREAISTNRFFAQLGLEYCPR